MNNTVTMYDSAGGYYPETAKWIMAPINGQFATVNGISQLQYIKEKWPNAWIIQYAVEDQESVPVYDCEPECIWPPTKMVTILKREVNAGRRPCLYASQSTMSVISGELSADGLAIGTDHRIDGLLADPLTEGMNVLSVPRSQTIPFPYIGIQRYWGPNEPGGYDTSLVYASWGALKPRSETNNP